MEPHSFSFDYSEKPAATAKKAVAPLKPTPPQVYKVDPINFRDVVQKLTAGPEFQDRRLRAMPNPRANVSDMPRPSAGRRDLSGEGFVSYNGYLGQSYQKY